MSEPKKPREFWVEYNPATGMPKKVVKQTFMPTIHSNYETVWTQVIEKSAADDLVEALALYVEIDICLCTDTVCNTCKAKQALKRYRGEDE